MSTQLLELSTNLSGIGIQFPDAVMFAETARAAAKDIADGKGDKAANMMKLQQQCGGCHMAHRVGGRGNFSFK